MESNTEFNKRIEKKVDAGTKFAMWIIGAGALVVVGIGVAIIFALVSWGMSF